MKKKLLTALLCALMLTGCGGKKPVPEVPAQPEAPAVTQPESPTEPEQKPEDPDVFRTLLDRYYFSIVQEHWDGVQAWGLASRAMVLDAADIGYAFLDLNGDGEEELLITAAPEVLAVYAVRGETVPTAIAEETCQMFLLEEDGNPLLMMDEYVPYVSNNAIYVYQMNEYAGLDVLDQLACREDGYYRMNSPYDMIRISDDEHGSWSAYYYGLLTEIQSTPLAAYPYEGDLTESDIPMPTEIAWKNAGERDIAAIWPAPMDAMVRQAGGLQLQEEHGEVFVIMALQDRVEVSVASGWPILTDDGYLDGWDTETNLYDTSLRAGEMVAVQMLSGEGMPSRCVLFHAETADGDLLGTMWPVAYDGMYGYGVEEGGCFYVTAPSW